MNQAGSFVHFHLLHESPQARTGQRALALMPLKGSEELQPSVSRANEVALAFNPGEHGIGAGLVGVKLNQKGSIEIDHLPSRSSEI